MGMNEKVKEKAKEGLPKVTQIVEGNTGTLTVKLLDELNKICGLNYDVNVEVHKQLLSIDNRLRNIMEQPKKTDDSEE